MFKDQLTQRLHYLEELESKLSKRIQKLPKGSLRISHSHGRTQYYHRKSSTDRQGVYVPAKDAKLFTGLAQKEYDEDVLRVVRQEIKAIKECLLSYPSNEAEDLYPLLRGERQALVTPLVETDQMYREQWEQVEYAGNPYAIENPDAELVTDRGETVRSKSELIIANALAKEGIPYRYECPLYLDGLGTVYPDFTVLNLRLRKEYYWEHQGMMDDPDYVERAVRKLNSYQKNGIYPGDKLILTSETRETPLNVRLIQDTIAHYFH